MQRGFLPSADTLVGGGSVTSPGSHGTICLIAAPPAGKYRIRIRYALTGTAETALSNVELAANGGTPYTGLPSLTGAGFNEAEFYLTLNGSASVNLRATAAAVAGAIYTGQIVLTQLYPLQAGTLT